MNGFDRLYAKMYKRQRDDLYNALCSLWSIVENQGFDDEFRKKIEDLTHHNPYRHHGIKSEFDL
jgi:hypothetical protein